AAEKFDPARLPAPINFLASAEHIGLMTPMFAIKGHVINPMCAAVSSDRKTLALGGVTSARPEQPAQLVPSGGGWRLGGVGKDEPTALLRAGATPVVSLAFAPSGKLLAAGGFDRTVRLWDPSTGKELPSLVENSRFVTCVHFADSGKSL